MSASGWASGSDVNTWRGLPGCGRRSEGGRLFDAEEIADLRELPRMGIESKRPQARLAADPARARIEQVAPQLPRVWIVVDGGSQRLTSGREVALSDLGLSGDLPRLRRPGHPRHRVLGARLGIVEPTGARRRPSVGQSAVPVYADEARHGEDEAENAEHPAGTEPHGRLAAGGRRQNRDAAEERARGQGGHLPVPVDPGVSEIGDERAEGRWDELRPARADGGGSGYDDGGGQQSEAERP